MTGYRLWRQTDADGTFTQLGSDLAATLLTQTDSTVSNGHVYRYWLQGLADAGPGVPSATTGRAGGAGHAVTVPDAVTALNTATATTSTTAGPELDAAPARGGSAHRLPRGLAGERHRPTLYWEVDGSRA